jgi:competence protein ComEC
MPFGFDGVFWRLMGEGIGWMIAVALWVTSLPGAVGRMPAFGTGALLVGTGGIILLCLLRTPLRFTGALLVGASILMAVLTPQPDALVSADGRAFAIRMADGRLAMIRTGNDTFALREWLAADGDARSEKDGGLAQGIACDRIGCVGRLSDNRVVAMAHAIEAFEEDCRHAALVFSARDAPPGCAATVVDRRALQRHGAVAVHRAGDRFVLVPARPAGYDRPWARALPAPDIAASSPVGLRPAQSPDATPRQDDLDADDQ